MDDLRRMIEVHKGLALLYKDTRFHPNPSCDFRSFVSTAIWVTGVEIPPRGQRLARVKEILGLTDLRLQDMLRADVPRWHPENSNAWSTACPAPMIRRDGECGRPGTRTVRVTSPVDGTWRHVYYCHRHNAVADQVKAEQRALEQAGAFPEPMPNRGGLGPCYLGWNWEDWYRWAAGPKWQPPTVGIRADDWPTLAKVHAARRKPFAVLTGEGEGGGPEGDLPLLRVVTEDER